MSDNTIGVFATPELRFSSRYTVGNIGYGHLARILQQRWKGVGVCPCGCGKLIDIDEWRDVPGQSAT